MKKIIISFSLLILTVFSAFSQCPMCKASVESSQKGGGKAVGMGLNPGILFMLVTVYAVVGFIALSWYRKYRRSNKAL